MVSDVQKMRWLPQPHSMTAMPLLGACVTAAMHFHNERPPVFVDEIAATAVAIYAALDCEIGTLRGG